MGILRYELKKLFNLPTMAVFICIILIKPLTALFYCPPEYQFNTQFYNEYTDSLYGEATPEKEQFIHDELDRIATLIGQQEEKENEYMLGVISEQEYSSYLKERLKSINSEAAITRLSDKYDYYTSLDGTGKTPYFFHDLEADEFLAGFGGDVLFLIFLILFGLRFWDSDRQYGMLYAVNATPFGREKRDRLRLAATVVFSTAGCIISFMVDMITYFMRCPAETLTMPVCSLEQFAGCGYDISILGYMLLILLIRVVWSAVLCFIIMLVYRIVGNMYACAVLSAAIVIIPFVQTGIMPSWLCTVLAGAQLTGFAVRGTSVLSSIVSAVITVVIFYTAYILVSQKIRVKQ